MTDRTETPSITEFLLARIAEDEASAEWVAMVFPDGDVTPLFHRVLRECAAKREIIEAHQSYFTKNSVCMTCREFFNDDSEDYPCQTVRALAAVYSDHPDYQDAWAL